MKLPSTMLEGLRNTPSRNDGQTYEEEISVRRKYARFIRDIGEELELDHYVMNTAIVLMQQFYMENSFMNVNGFDVGKACLKLSCKKLGYRKKNVAILQAAQSCCYPRKPVLDVESEEHRKQLNNLLDISKLLNLFFERSRSQVRFPVNILLCIRLWTASLTVKLPLMANRIANEVYSETLFPVMYNAKEIAAFCVYLACKLTGFENDENPFWKDLYLSITESQLIHMEEECTVMNKSFPQLLKNIFIDNLNMYAYEVNSREHFLESSSSKRFTPHQRSDIQSSQSPKKTRYTLDEYKNRQKPINKTGNTITKPELKGLINLDEGTLRQMFHDEPNKLCNFLKYELGKHRQLTDRESSYLYHLEKNREKGWLSRYQFVPLHQQQQLLNEMFRHDPRQLFKLLTEDIPRLRPLVGAECDCLKILELLLAKKAKPNVL